LPPLRVGQLICGLDEAVERGGHPGRVGDVDSADKAGDVQTALAHDLTYVIAACRGEAYPHCAAVVSSLPTIDKSLAGEPVAHSSGGRWLYSEFAGKVDYALRTP
jgi:hypothetical protein